MKTRRKGGVVSANKRRRLQVAPVIDPPVRPEEVVSLDLPFPFNTVPNEMIAHVLQDANQYDLSTLGGTCWAFHEYIARRHPLERSPRPLLDYSLLKSISGVTEDAFNDEFAKINVLANGDSVVVSFNKLRYLRFGHYVWQTLIENDDELHHPEHFFLIAGKYLVVNAQKGVSVWCVKDVMGEIQHQKLQFIPHCRDDVFYWRARMHVRKNNDIIVIAHFRILEVLQYNPHNEQSPFSVVVSRADSPLSPEYSLSFLIQAGYSAHQNLVFCLLHCLYLWDLENDQLTKWQRKTILQRFQSVLTGDEVITGFNITFKLAPPLGYVAMKTITNHNYRNSKYYLLNLNHHSPPLFLCQGQDDDLEKLHYKLTSRGDIVLLREEVDGWHIFSDWDSKENIFRSKQSLQGLIDRFNRWYFETFSSEGDIILSGLVAPNNSVFIMKWNHQTKKINDLYEMSYNLLQLGQFTVHCLPSADVILQTENHRLKILDGETGGVKKSLKFGSKLANGVGSTRICVLPSGDIQVKWLQTKSKSTAPFIHGAFCSNIYRFGIWRPPEEKATETASDQETSLVKLAIQQ